RPCIPNSGYSLGKTAGSAVQNECVACSRCIVSEVPSSPDCTTNAESPAARANRNKGLLSQRWTLAVIAGDGNTEASAKRLADKVLLSKSLRENLKIGDRSKSGSFGCGQRNPAVFFP